jgi:predicted nucleic acid-binding protein
VIVLDSSFLIAFHNSRDVHHERAKKVMAELLDGRWGHGLLLEYVFLEVMTVLLARRGLDVASAVAEVLLGAREVDFVPCSEIFLDTVEIFRSQRGPRLSFADAAIVQVARRRTDGLVATFDHDFLGVDGISVVPGEPKG